MLSSIVPVPNSQTSAQSQPCLAVAAKTNVEQLGNDQSSAVSTPINVDKLPLELVYHIHLSFVKYLINALPFGTHIGFTGP